MGLRVFNSAKSSNPNYWVSLRIENAGLGDLSEGDDGLVVITDMPEQVMQAVSSSWEQRLPSDIGDLMGKLPVVGPGIQKAFQASGINPTFQIGTYQTWQSSSPMEFPLTLLFDAKSDAKKEVYDPINALTTYAQPSTNATGAASGSLLNTLLSLGGNVLFAPGPNNINRDKYSVKLRVGRLYYIADGILVNLQGSFDSKLDKKGYPIAGQVEISVRTGMVYSRSDWIKATSFSPDGFSNTGE